MNLTFNCNVSLSKKLRSILNSEKARVVLHVNNVENGIGQGTLSVYTEGNNCSIPEDFIAKETSISLTPISIQDEMQNINRPVGNIFSDKHITKSNVRTPISKLAVIEVPEHQEEIHHAIKTESEIAEETPKEFNELKNPKIKKFVKNIEELMESVERAKNKVAPIDISTAKNPREKVVMLEQIQKMEAISEDAFIVNTKCQSISINDLDIQLSLNTPFNLNNISAKRIAASKDFQTVLESGFIKIITPSEVKQYEKLAIKGQTIESGLKTYDRRGAENNLFDGGSNEEAEDAEVMEVGNNDLDGITEEEKLMNMTSVGRNVSGGINLSGGANSSSSQNGVKRTTFSSGGLAKPLVRPNQQTRQDINQDQSTENTSNISKVKLIKKL